MVAVTKEFIWLGPLVVLALIALQITLMHHYYDRDLKGIIPFILIFTLAGLIIDSVFMHTGLLAFSSNPFHNIISPPWMMLLWLELGIALFISGHKVFHQYGLMAIAAVIGAALFYAGLDELSAVYFYDDWYDTILIACVWGVVFPLCLYLHSKITG